MIDDLKRPSLVAFDHPINCGVDGYPVLSERTASVKALKFGIAIVVNWCGPLIGSIFHLLVQIRRAVTGRVIRRTYGLGWRVHAGVRLLIVTAAKTNSRYELPAAIDQLA